MNRNLTALILIVLAIGIYFTITEKMVADVKAVQAVNAEYASAIDSAEKLIKIRDQVRKDYNEISPEDRDKLEKLIPSSVDNIRLIIDLNNVAVRHGFTLKNIKASADKESSRTQASQSAALRAANAQQVISIPVLDTVTVSFSVTAPYQQFIAFMQDVEASLRIMDITKLNIKSSDTGVYDYNVEIKTYWLRE